MFDDNFKNSSSEDFIALPYLNLIVTVNNFPNLIKLTEDKLKLMTVFPIYKDRDCLKVIDFLFIPVVVEISVRIQKGTINNLLEYQYNLKLQEDDGIEKNFSKFKYFHDILSNVRKSQEFRSSDDFNREE